MSLTTLSDNPVYAGRLATSTVCIALLGVCLVSALLKIPFDRVIPAGILATIAAVLAAVAIAISDSGTVPGDDS